MKKLLLFLILFSSLNLSATHILGGNISVRNVSFDSVTQMGLYSITLDLLRDCTSPLNAALDFDPIVGIFNQSGVEFTFVYMNRDTIENVQPSFGPHCLMGNLICVERGIFSQTVYLPYEPNGYIFSYSRCCRSHLINNLTNPGAAGFTVSVSLYDMINSSPVSNNGLPAFGFTNFPLWFDASTSDLEGNDIRYNFAPTWLGNAQGAPTGTQPPPYSIANYAPSFGPFSPIPTSTPLRYDNINGILSGTPSTQGAYAIAFNVQEYRNGRLISSSHFESTIFVFPYSNSLQISGDVMVDSIKLDTGRVEIYRKNPILDTLILVATAPVSNGSYQFSGLSSTEYYLRAFPDSSSVFFISHFPTYYRRSVLWYDVVSSTPCLGSLDSINIHLVQAYYPLLTPGNGRITGAIENRRYPRAIGIELYLMDEFGTPVLRGITDNNGAFSFSNLPYGRYQLMVNLPNSGIRNQYPLVIDVAVGNPLRVGLQIALLTDRLQLLTPLSIEENHLGATLQLFPNPTHSDATLRLDLTETSHISVTVQDYLGRTLQSKDLGWQSAGTLNESIHLSGLANGIYFVRVRTDKGEQVMKLVMNDRR